MTISNFNESINNLKFHEETFNNNFEKLYNFSHTSSTEINKLKLSETVAQHIILLTYLTTETNEQLDNIVNALLFAKRNTLHPSVLSPMQLTTELNSNLHMLKNGINFPVLPILENAHILIDIIKLQVYFLNGKIIYVTVVQIFL